MSDKSGAPVGTPFPELYSDTKGTNQDFVPGTLIKPSSARSIQEHGTGEVGAGVAAEFLGAPFPLHKPIPHNIVEYGDNGEMTVTPVSEAAIELIRSQNHVERGQKGNPISMKEAVRVVNSGGTVKVAAPAGIVMRPPAQPAVSSGAGDIPPGVPQPFVSPNRVQIRFEGSFGRFAAQFSQFFFDADNPHLLILEQYGQDGMFFEAPQVTDPIIVRIGDAQYNCVPAAFFTLPDGTTRYTILALAE